MIIPYTKINKSGQKISYWTHSSFLDDAQVQKIRESEGRGRTIRNYIALVGAIVGLQATSIPSVSKLLPSKIPLPGVVGISALGFFALGHLIFVSGKAQKQVMSLLDNSTIPLWKDKKNVININRAFFHLDQNKHNKIDLLHHGLTAESAARIFPDLISGPAPKAPEPEHHGDHHGDQHGHEKEHGHKQEKHH